MGLVPTNTIRDQLSPAAPAAPTAGGIFKKLLGDPMRMQLLLSGMGLLGSKRQSQADRYYGGIREALAGMNQAPLQQAQIKNLGAQTGLYEAQAAAEGQLDAPWSGSGGQAGALRIVSEMHAKMLRGEQLDERETAQFQAAKAFLSQQSQGFTPGGQPIMMGGMNFGYMDQQPGALPPSGQQPGMPPQQPGMPPQQPAIPGATPSPMQGGLPQQPVQQVYPQTPAQISVDQKMADEYVKWTTGGGYSDVKKNLLQLQSALFSLESGQVQTGDWKALVSSLAPDKWVSYLRPDFMDTREKVEEVAQRNLKEVLGAQFAKIEGEQLIKRAYNPNISTELNAERVRRLMQQMAEAVEAKQAAMEYYSKNGTMVGYAEGINSLDDLEASLAKQFSEQKLWGDMKGQKDGGAIYYDPISDTWSDQQ